MACTSTNKEISTEYDCKEPAFGKARNGDAVELYTLTNAKGMEATIMTYGGIVTSLRVPDRTGKLDDVVLGFDTIDGYLGDPPAPYFGALIGRYGNRIAKGRFTLNGTEYKLRPKQRRQCPPRRASGLRQGGLEGQIAGSAESRVTYFSKMAEEGYPGNLTSAVVYTVTDNNELKLDYSATTDKDTRPQPHEPFLFNLAGQGEGDVQQHTMMINADKFTPWTRL